MLAATLPSCTECLLPRVTGLHCVTVWTRVDICSLHGMADLPLLVSSTDTTLVDSLNVKNLPVSVQIELPDRACTVPQLENFTASPPRTTRLPIVFKIAYPVLSLKLCFLDSSAEGNMHLLHIVGSIQPATPLRMRSLIQTTLPQSVQTLHI